MLETSINNPEITGNGPEDTIGAHNFADERVMLPRKDF